MKTPKRTPWQHSTQSCLKADGELRCTITEQATRWKRKNRVKQLKRTIERLNAELRKMKNVKQGEKYYMEVEVDIEHDPDSVWIFHPDHPANEYSGICVYKKHLIPKMEIEKENAELRKETK